MENKLTDEQIRLECLKIAIKHINWTDLKDLSKRTNSLVNYVKTGDITNESTTITTK